MAVPLPDDVVARLKTANTVGSVACRMSGQGAATLLLYGDIGWEVTALGVTQALNAIGAVASLDIRICSLGGSVFDGWAIYNTLARHAATTKTVTIEGVAASMASIIAMVGTEIVMPANSYMMIHNPAGFCAGSADDMASMSELLLHMQGLAAETYAARTGQDLAIVATMMGAETYMAAEQALALGFADRIEEPMVITAKLDLSKLPTMPPRMRADLSKEPTMPKTNQETKDTAANDTANPAGGADDTATAQMIADACAGAGLPALIPSMLRAPVTMAAVTARIEEAKAITEAATRAGVPAMAGELVTAGVSAETARKLIFTAKAEAGDAVRTDTAHGGASPAAPALSAPEIFTRFNKRPGA